MMTPEPCSNPARIWIPTEDVLRMANRPTAVDLFAGAGGMSLGFEQAGFDIVAAVEVDPVHAATHHFNFPNTAVIPRSVVGLTGHAIRTAAGLGQEAVDVVFGGPPCQGFSLMGHRMLDDDRNRLVREFVRLVEELEARAFVFENVKGLPRSTRSAPGTPREGSSHAHDPPPGVRPPPGL